MQFLRPSVVRQNVNLLSRGLGISNAISSTDAYVKALAGMQGWDRYIQSRHGLAIFFQGDRECDGVFSHFLRGYDIPALKPFESTEVDAIGAALIEALDVLARLDGDARETFDLLVLTLLIVRIPAFGSMSDALGIVMAGPEPDWSRLEIAELLWHEAVHQALFLEELLHGLFLETERTIGSREAVVRNPLLGVDRPFNLAFHGVAVSVALLDLHCRAGLRQRASKLVASIVPAINELAARRHLLTSRGAEILDEVVADLQSLASAVAQLPDSCAESEHMRPLRQSHLDLPPSWRARVVS